MRNTIIVSICGLLLSGCGGHRRASESGIASGGSYDVPPPPESKREAAREPTREPPREPTREPPREPTREPPREPTRVPSSAGVKAGAADDNLQFNAFLEFLDAHARWIPGPNVSDRVIVRVVDQNGAAIANARVTGMVNGELVESRTTFADGRAMLFPSERIALRSQSAEVHVEYNGVTAKRPIGPGKRTLEIALNLVRKAPRVVPLDLAFILDTTGSMGEEIDRLKQTIEVVHQQITHLEPKPDVRFGMVLYRDREEQYLTQLIPFTDDVRAFRRKLDEVEAGGGGDYPEDVNAGLDAALKKLAWRDRDDGIRLAFLIGDAPPHAYSDEPSYIDSMHAASARGIKIAGIGASGLTIEGEVVWRQIAQYTMAPFVFLTHGENDDVEGSAVTVSHHVGANWIADNLDALVVRLVKVELAAFGKKTETREDYFEAVSQAHVPNDEVLAELFRQSSQQLLDYAVERIDDRTPTVMLPIASKDPKLAALGSKLESRLALGLTGTRALMLIESKERAKLLDTLAAQMSETYDSGKMVEAGKLVPAKLAVISELNVGTSGVLEMLVRLVRLETGEVLSISLMKIQEQMLAAN